MKLKDFELHFCSVVAITAFLLALVFFFMTIEPFILTRMMKTVTARCETTSHNVTCGITNCTWSSCYQSCAGFYNCCHHIRVRLGSKQKSVHDLESIPLYVNPYGCSAFADCPRFFKNHSSIGTSFDCLYMPRLSIAVPEGNRVSLKYIVFTTAPFVVLLLSCIYAKLRKLFPKGSKKIEQCVRVTGEPKSYYQRKLKAIEKMKQERLERLKRELYQDDVKVEDLETVTALILKPDSCWMTGLSK